MKLIDPSGRTLDAEFELETTPEGIDLILHARYGGRNSSRGTNVDYFPALELLLERLARANATINSAAVDSKTALQLPPQDRVLDLPFPIPLGPATEVSELRLKLTRAQRTVARDPSALPRGGNNHKRIRISLALPGVQAVENLTALLVGGTATSDTDKLGADYRDADSDPTITPADVFTFDPSTRERALAGHARVQNALAEHLRSLGIEPRSSKRGEPDFDLAWECGEYFVAEVKSLSGSNEDRQLRLGLGQVLHYRHQLGDLYGPTRAVLAVEREPGPGWQALCAELGVALTWPPAWPALVATST